MAKYTVTNACGHAEDVRLYGRQADRYEALDKMRAKICADCWNAQRRAEGLTAIAEGLATGLPNLQGSEKQTTWAAVIRRSWLPRLAVALDEIRQRCRAAERESFQFSIGQIESLADIEAAAREIEGKAESRYWIDTREILPRQELLYVARDIRLRRERSQAAAP